ncbi:MAG: MipA/OmpV family protein [Gammaproteobacteria bacterium]|nr:MipA/OmpV family protein [Gammaproteobacteria bacterium]
MMKHQIKTLWVFAMMILPCWPLAASETSEPNDWGIAVGFRNAEIPFPTAEDRVSDFIPLMFYEGERFFIRGLTGGVRLYKQGDWKFNLIGRYRYFDIPAEYQNLVRGSGTDVGLQARYAWNEKLESNIELMAADKGRVYGVFNTRLDWESGNWELIPFATLRWKSADFNDHYFGLDGFIDPNDFTNRIDNKIGSALDLALGGELRYHVVSNLYLIGRAQITVLDNKTADSPSIAKGSFGEYYLGFGFFRDKSKPARASLETEPYVRVAYGWASPSNIGDILRFQGESDPQNNEMTSIFYGHPIADDLFGLQDLDLYITTGFVYHLGSDPYSQTLEPGEGVNIGDEPLTLTYDSQPTQEYVLGIKAYYNLHWPMHWRFGFAEGISYIRDISNLEQREMDYKGYRTSNLMNYLDFTLDADLSPWLLKDSGRALYLGIGVHHRSSIFEQSSSFGRIKGGSNYPSVYLQYSW